MTKTYIDETLRFEVDENYPNKVLDLYSLTITELENELDLKRFTPSLPIHKFKTYDDWYQVKDELENLKELAKDISIVVSVYGYDFTDCNHYIKLYFNIRYSN